MGRDKPPAPARGDSKKGSNTDGSKDTTAPGAAPGAGAGTTGTRPPKGHRQRGAGTVIVAKPAVVTNDGVVLKAHERLPCQLLNEYCQQSKRPKPHYRMTPPGHRFTVWLPDVKNSKLDLSFCPVQSFDTDSVAKDFSALLALKHFQKNMPLERKLPEPYATTWLEMIAADKAEQGRGGAKGGGKQAGGNPSTAPSATTTEAGAGARAGDISTPSSGSGSNAKVAGSLVTSSKVGNSIPNNSAAVQQQQQQQKGPADWLCDNCGKQNFATLLSGTIRTKCFSCQTAKSDSVTLVISTVPVTPPSKLNATLTATSSASSNSAIGGVSRTGATIGMGNVAKAAPAAVLDLRARSTHASKGEADRAKLEIVAARNRKKSYFEALRRANRPTVVYLSASLRRMLESILGFGMSSSSSNSCDLRQKGANGLGEEEGSAATLEDLLQSREDAGGWIALESCLLRAKVQSDLISELVFTLKGKGFKGKQLQASFHRLLSSGSVSRNIEEDILDFVDKIPNFDPFSSDKALTIEDVIRATEATALSTNDSSSGGGAFKQLCAQFKKLWTENVVEDLCRHLSEDELPSGFSAVANQQKPKFTVIPTAKKTTTVEVSTTTTVSAAVSSSIATVRLSPLGSSADAASQLSNAVNETPTTRRVISAAETYANTLSASYGWGQQLCLPVVQLVDFMLSNSKSNSNTYSKSSHAAADDDVESEEQKEAKLQLFDSVSPIVLSLLSSSQRHGNSKTATAAAAAAAVAARVAPHVHAVKHYHHRRSNRNGSVNTINKNGAIDKTSSSTTIYVEANDTLLPVHCSALAEELDILRAIYDTGVKIERTSLLSPTAAAAAAAAGVAASMWSYKVSIDLPPMSSPSSDKNSSHGSNSSSNSSNNKGRRSKGTAAGAAGAAGGGGTDHKFSLEVHIFGGNFDIHHHSGGADSSDRSTFTTYPNVAPAVVAVKDIGNTLHNNPTELLELQKQLSEEADSLAASGEIMIFQLHALAVERLERIVVKEESVASTNAAAAATSTSTEMDTVLVQSMCRYIIEEPLNTVYDDEYLKKTAANCASFMVDVGIRDEDGKSQQQLQQQEEEEEDTETKTETAAISRSALKGEDVTEQGMEDSAADLFAAAAAANDQEDEESDNGGEDNDGGDATSLGETVSSMSISSADKVVNSTEQKQQQNAPNNSSSNSNNKKGRNKNGSGSSKHRHQQGPSFWSTLSSTTSNNSKVIDPNRDEIAYDKMLQTRKELPAWKMRQTILDTMAATQGLVLTGETGCGKSTQTPQFLFEQDQNIKILVCQPRRLAAMTVAARVASEMAVPLGTTVGYMVKGSSTVCPDTRIAFCTYGVLLRRLQDDPLLAGINYIILDEIHERGLDSDFALALLIPALRKRPDLKIILMSATISTDKFAAYLGKYVNRPSLPVAGGGSSSSRSINNNNNNNAQHDCKPVPVLFIPGFTYPVEEFYRADFEYFLRPVAFGSGSNANNNKTDRVVPDSLAETVDFERIGGRMRPGDIDFDLLVRLVLHLAGCPAHVAGLSASSAAATATAAQRKATGTILVFVPGVPEINRVISLISQELRGGGDVVLLPLHGTMSQQDQQKAVTPLPGSSGGRRIKVVVATNVAEASVTIPDVSVVVDSCRVKEMNYDSERGIGGLVSKLAAVDSLTQRRGRAGRVQSGRCFRLITSGTFAKLAQHSVPEMLRSPLERVVLQVKAMVPTTAAAGGGSSSSGGSSSQQQQQSVGVRSSAGTGESKNMITPSSFSILRKCPDPPSEEAVSSAEALLLQMQALSVNSIGSSSNSNNGNNTQSLNLTPLGYLLSTLPCSPRVGRLIIYGSMLGCVFPATYAAACMLVRSPVNVQNAASAQDAAAKADEIMSFFDSEDMPADLRSDIGGSINGSSSMWLPSVSGCKSDYAALVNIGLMFNACRNKYKFCNKFSLSYDRMTEIRDTQMDLLQGLVDIGCLSSVDRGTNFPPPVTTVLQRRSDDNNSSTAHSSSNNNKAAATARNVVLHPNRNAFKPRLLNAVFCAGMYPQMARVLRPPQRYVEVMGGMIERDAEAREMKIYIPSPPTSSTVASGGGSCVTAPPPPPPLPQEDSRYPSNIDISTEGYQRVFIHPSSLNFNNTDFSRSNFVLFGEKQQQNTLGAGALQSKIYLRNTAEVSAFALLFFGGKLSADYLNGIVTVDSWIRLSAPGKIVALILGIRSEFDQLFMSRIAESRGMSSSNSNSGNSSGGAISSHRIGAEGYTEREALILDCVSSLLSADGL